MRVHVVFNPVKADAAELEAAVHEAAADADVALFETAESDHGRGAVVEALEGKPDVLLVAGGDGTVRIAAGLAADTEVPLGVVPRGTGNLLARNLSLPLGSVQDAVRAAVLGATEVIDVGLAAATFEDGTTEEFPFTVMIGFGLDAETMTATDDDAKAKIGWLAYIGGFFKAFRSVDRVRVVVEVPGEEPERLAANTVMVGNAGQIQGGVHLLPDAQLNDGLLDVAVMDPTNPLQWMSVANEVMAQSAALPRFLRRRGLLPDHKDTTQLQFRQLKAVTLRLAEPKELQIDGDTVGKITQITCTVRPACLRVRVTEPLPPAPSLRTEDAV